MALTTIANGDLPTVAPMMANFQQVYYSLLASDATGSSVWGTTAVAHTYTFAPNTILRFIEITIKFNAGGYADHEGSGYCGFTFKIGETGIEATKLDLIPLQKSNSGSLHQYAYVNEQYTLLYEPTPDEKTNGFNVIIGIYSTGTRLPTMSYQSSYIMGI